MIFCVNLFLLSMLLAFRMSGVRVSLGICSISRAEHILKSRQQTLRRYGWFALVARDNMEEQNGKARQKCSPIFYKLQDPTLCC